MMNNEQQNTLEELPSNSDHDQNNENSAEIENKKPKKFTEEWVTKPKITEYICNTTAAVVALTGLVTLLALVTLTALSNKVMNLNM